MNGCHCQRRTRLAGLTFGLLALGTSAGLRAQFTETTATVAPADWLIEVDLLNHGRQQTAAGDYRYWGVGYAQLTRGLRPRLDAQVAVHAFQREEFRPSAGAAEDDEAALEWYLRAKWQVANDLAGWSLALLPYVYLPDDGGESRRRRLEPGLIVPVSRGVGDWWIDAQLWAHWQDASLSGREWSWLASGNLQRSWGPRWGGYFEAIADCGTESWSDAAVLAGVGITRRVGERGGWDAAVYAGVTDAAMDWEVAVRLYWKL